MTLPDDLRRQVHRDAGASVRTLGLLEAAADEIERLQCPDGREAPVWSAIEMADLLQAMARSADRHFLAAIMPVSPEGPSCRATKPTSSNCALLKKERICPQQR